jgi:hypothetical protein
VHILGQDEQLGRDLPGEGHGKQQVEQQGHHLELKAVLQHKI